MIFEIFSKFFKTLSFKTRTNEDIFPRKDLPKKSFVSEHTQKKKYLEEMTTQKSKEKNVNKDIWPLYTIFFQNSETEPLR